MKEGKLTIEYTPSSNLVRVFVDGEPLSMLHRVSIEASNLKCTEVVLEYPELSSPTMTQATMERYSQSIELANRVVGAAVRAPCPYCSQYVWSNQHTDSDCTVMQVMES